MIVTYLMVIMISYYSIYNKFVIANLICNNDYYSYLEHCLFNNIDTTNRPNYKVSIQIELFLTKIHDSKISSSDTTILSSVYLIQKWNDSRLKWNYENKSLNIKLARVISEKIWM
jgi:hypothetical protein